MGITIEEINRAREKLDAMSQEDFNALWDKASAVSVMLCKRYAPLERMIMGDVKYFVRFQEESLSEMVANYCREWSDGEPEPELCKTIQHYYDTSAEIVALSRPEFDILCQEED